VLEIDDRRAFGYESVYFDTPDLRCFSDHVEGRLPRFKARTRYYRDSDHCVFEVKLKRTENETDKRQLEYRPDDRDRVTSAGASCVDEALDDLDLELREPLAPRLRTSFSRATLAAGEGAERLTCDVDVRLRAPGGHAVVLRDDLVLLEAKSQDGDSPADRVLADTGVSPVSLSKYRVGTALLGGVDAGEQPGQGFFA
jgi:VTC domain